MLFYISSLVASICTFGISLHSCSYKLIHLLIPQTCTKSSGSAACVSQIYCGSMFFIYQTLNMVMIPFPLTYLQKILHLQCHFSTRIIWNSYGGSYKITSTCHLAPVQHYVCIVNSCFNGIIYFLFKCSFDQSWIVVYLPS